MRSTGGESTSVPQTTRFSRPGCARWPMPRLARSPRPDRMHRGQIARLALGQKALGDRRDQCVGHGMSGAGAADQQRIAGGDELRSFIGRDDARCHIL